MRVNGGWIHWSNNCKYISPIGLAVTLRNSKEDCAESCVESATCVSFQFKRKLLVRLISIQTNVYQKRKHSFTFRRQRSLPTNKG